MSIFGFIAVGIDRELFDGLDRRRIRSNPALAESAAGIGRDAVQRGAVRSSLPAADAEAVIAAQILGIGRKRRQVERSSDRAVDNKREIVNKLVLQRDAVLRVFRLQ